MVVTVVCICYNQSSFLRESVESVFSQTYPDIELWLLDDHSTDGSPELIRELKSQYPEINTYISDENIGHNRLFNRFLPVYKGDALIDLAGDDILCPERVDAGVRAFLANAGCGVHFTNTLLIDESGKEVKTHYPVDNDGRAAVPVPEGDLFADLLGRYLINPVSMMIRREVLHALQGFDEELSYEDFDFWVRSSRDFRYCYTDQVLVKKRLHPANYSLSQYRFGSRQMRDTYRVCCKAATMIRSDKERSALRKRIGYEMRQCLRHGNLRLFRDYLKLL